jgi:hypothetical protein
MTRKHAKRSQAQKPLPPLSAETLETIQAAVFLYEDEPVIGLGKIDEVHGRRADSAGRIFRRYRNNFIEGIHYVLVKKDAFSEEEVPNDSTVPSGDTQCLDFEPVTPMIVSRGDASVLSSSYRGETMLFYLEGYLTVADRLSDPLDRQIQAAVGQAFDSLAESVKKSVSDIGPTIAFTYNDIPVHFDADSRINAKEMRRAAKASAKKAPMRWLQSAVIQGLIASGSKFFENRQVIALGQKGNIWIDREISILYAAYLGVEFLFAFRQSRAWSEDKLVSISRAEAPIAETPSARAVFPAEFERFGAKLDDMMALLQREAQENRQDLLAVRDKLSGEIAVARGEVAAIQGAVVAVGESVSAEAAASRKAMLARFAQTENFHLDQNKHQFFRLWNVVAEELVKLQKAWRGDARAILEEIAQRIDRAFRQFEETHFPAPSESLPPQQLLQPQSRESRADAAGASSGAAERVAGDQDQRRVAVWWDFFGETKRRAGEIAALAGGSLVEGSSALSKSMRLAHWIDRAVKAQTVFVLGKDGPRLRICSQQLFHASGPRLYWLQPVFSGKS